MDIIINLIWMQVVAPFVWVFLFGMGVMLVLKAKKSEVNIKKYSLKPSIGNSDNKIAAVIYISIILASIGIIYSKTFGFGGGILSLVLLGLGDILTIILVVLYFNVLSAISMQMKKLNGKGMTSLPIIYFLFAVMVTATLQLMTYWVFIRPALSPSF